MSAPTFAIRFGVEQRPQLEINALNSAEFCRLALSFRSRGRRVIETDIAGILDYVELMAEQCADLPPGDLFPEARR